MAASSLHNIQEAMLNLRVRYQDDCTYAGLQAVDSIRMIIISHGEPRERVRCQLLDVRLSGKPSFEALSYTWQDSFAKAALEARKIQHKSTIFLSGDVLRITPIVQAAFRRLRQTGCDRTFWIDSICINQMDDQERSQQVSIMGRIYQQARQVVIWLGDTDSSTEEAISLIMIFGFM